MFTRFILVCFVIGFFSWLIFADYLWYLYVMDIDKFWITVSIAGIVLVFSSFWMVLSARLSEIENRPCACCGSTSREYGPEGLNPYCPHCGEPDSDGD